MPLDIGVGIVLSIIASHTFGVPLSPLLMLFTIAAALLPDIDIVTVFFGSWKHRIYTHYPILYLPLFIVGEIFLPKPYEFLLIAGVLAHLVHDTIGTGWGISWLWPYTSRRFLFFPDGARRVQMSAIATWIPEEQPQYAHMPVQTHFSWIRRLYLRPNPVAYIEYGFLFLSILALLVYVYVPIG